MKEQEQLLKKKLEDEKQARLAAKQAEAKRKEELMRSNEILASKMAAAKAYYENQLLIKYGIIPFANLLVISLQSNQKAVLKNRDSIVKKHFRLLRVGTSI